jgi:hypothetical protein
VLHITKAGNPDQFSGLRLAASAPMLACRGTGKKAWQRPDVAGCRRFIGKE